VELCIRATTGAKQPTKPIVPTSLQMGWVESPPYFCATMETARNITSDYCNTPIGALPPHKFDKHLTGNKDNNALPPTAAGNKPCQYGLEVYVDNFMSIMIPTSQEQLTHVGRAIMAGILDIFPVDIIGGNDPISEKKLLKGEGPNSLFKTLLGFEFDGQRQKNVTGGTKACEAPNNSPCMDTS
jgi:hypothetical protein